MSALRPQAAGDAAGQGSAAQAAADSARWLLRGRGVAKRFGALTALHPLNLEVSRGETLALLGPNGAGKSVLLHILAGLLRPSEGALLRPGAAGSSRAAARRSVGLVGHASFLYPALSVLENLKLAAHLHGLPDASARARRELAAAGLWEAAELRAGALSRGLAQRAAVARALVHEPALLLLDEPFTGLDTRAADALARRLAARRAAGSAAVIVTHNLARASGLADRALLLRRGRGSWLPAADLASPQLLAAACDRALNERSAP